MSTDTQSSAPDCPFPCGWKGLHKIAVQDAAYLAKVQWPEDEEGVSVPRATAMRSMDYLIQVCRTMLNSASVVAQAQQSTNCASCGEIKQTPLRIDAMGGYVCLTCVDKKLCSMLAQQPVSGADGLPDTPTRGMNLGQRIAHVGGRENAQGYIEFGSPMAVDALIQHILRDLTTSTPQGAFQARYRAAGSKWSSWGAVTCGVRGHEQELRYLETEAQPQPLAQQDADKVDAERWISVNERLPEIHEWRAGSIAGISDAVLTIDEDDPDTMTVQHLRKGGQGDLTTLYWDHGDSPTHWRPAPSLPGIDAARKEQA